MTDTPSTNRDNGRDAGGRFATGNRGGPGNPFARRVARLRCVLLDSLSDEKLAAIVGALLKKAKYGDVAAAKLLLSYTVGQPTPVPDPDRLNTEALCLIRDTAHAMSAMNLAGMLNPNTRREVLDCITSRDGGMEDDHA